MNGPPASAARIASTLRSSAAPPARNASGSRLPCTGTPALDLVARKVQIDHPVQTNGIDFDILDVAFQVAAGAARKPDDLRARHRAPHIGNDSFGRRNAPALEFVRRQNSCPGIEDLHSVDAGLELPNEIFARRLDQNIDQPRERLGMPIGKQPRRRLIRRAMAGDHVGRDRPRRAAKSEQRHRRRQFRFDRAGSFRKSAPAPRRRPCRAASSSRPDRRAAQAAGLRRLRTERVRPSACGTTRISENKIAASKPNRRIGCSVTSAASFGVKHRSRKPPTVFADRHVLRQIAPGLAHHPDRRHGLALAVSTSRSGLCTDSPVSHPSPTKY